MSPVAWTARELETFDSAEEIEIAPRRPDGTARRFVPIWVVRVGDELYIRSWYGARGGWFCAAVATNRAKVRVGGSERAVALLDADDADDDAVDAAYQTKYGRYPAYVNGMTSPQARETTVKLVPDASEAHSA